MISILKVFTSMVMSLFKRGHGLFKFLFVIDDFFRLFTMTILIPIFFNWLNFPQILVNLGILLGLIIDVQDFIAEMGIRKFV